MIPITLFQLPTPTQLIARINGFSMALSNRIMKTKWFELLLIFSQCVFPDICHPFPNISVIAACSWAIWEDLRNGSVLSSCPSPDLITSVAQQHSNRPLAHSLTIWRAISICTFNRFPLCLTTVWGGVSESVWDRIYADPKHSSITRFVEL